MKTTAIRFALLFVPMTALLAAEDLPESVAAAFRDFRPNVGSLELVASARGADGSEYYIIWGSPTPPPGTEADSSYIDEAAFRVTDGKVHRINGGFQGIPAENYLPEPAVAQALDDSFVAHRIHELGGPEAAQNFLLDKSFITEPEARAWVRAGYHFWTTTRLVAMDGSPPFRSITLVQPLTGPDSILDYFPGFAALGDGTYNDLAGNNFRYDDMATTVGERLAGSAVDHPSDGTLRAFIQFAATHLATQRDINATKIISKVHGAYPPGVFRDTAAALGAESLMQALRPAPCFRRNSNSK